MSNNSDTFRTCPACGQLLPISQVRCDCGYEFEQPVVGTSSYNKQEKLFHSFCIGFCFIVGGFASYSLARFISDRSFHLLGTALGVFFFGIFVVTLEKVPSYDEQKKNEFARNALSYWQRLAHENEIANIPSWRRKAEAYDNLSDLLRAGNLIVPPAKSPPRSIIELSDALKALNAGCAQKCRSGDWPEIFLSPNRSVTELNFLLSNGYVANPYTGEPMRCIDDLIPYFERYNQDCEKCHK